MPSAPVVEQQIQAPEPMTTQSSNVEVEQPKAAPIMSTSGDAVGLRGGEEASCECCGCGCAEGCC
ncbi:hypothetical protein LHYA1_G003981 [Lachnellula hyalina]|uniref:Uncharacterized protein n=3 Tax=Lachnellula TaxID=47830 RepID=A0A8H8TZ83_9HELO|nr:uncharacterized protein LHYA1_G003981 [Lachnellula hyalina]TVY26125.1 hypothetical protein LHYA1_G003981 [Lachnellula hyalina]TVY37163.1 hypothetical protein LSUB1_G005838 [Lachnellula subtilissima]TVY88000.1 hypothetical protein LAWI1_G007079 [Lachnellula willkommii]